MCFVRSYSSEAAVSAWEDVDPSEAPSPLPGLPQNEPHIRPEAEGQCLRIVKRSPSPEAPQLPFSEVVAALSHALDLTEGQPPGHCLRCCWIGMHLGFKLGLSADSLADLYYTLLLKDAGCSSNAARLFQLYGSDDLSLKRDFKRVDSQNFRRVAWFVLRHTGLETGTIDRFKKLARLVREGEKLATEVIETRCYRGGTIAHQLGLNEDVSAAIRCLDEHYNGKGRPLGLEGKRIPLYSSIALLSQVADVFFAAGGARAALREVQSRSGTWFDPELASCFKEVARDPSFWSALTGEGLEERTTELEPQEAFYVLGDKELDAVASTFAEVIDAKSPFTYGHSTRVTEFADRIAQSLRLAPQRRRWLKRAALLHDIGKLGVSNSILDKPGPLTRQEFEKVKRHPKHSEEILGRISAFQEIAATAGAHHERLDGKGYYKGLSGREIVLETRILTVSDIFDALTADRPYRKAVGVKEALRILDAERGKGVDAECVQALARAV